MMAAPPVWRAAFEHERLESGLGQIEGGDQAVVTAADDDDVALFSHDLGSSLKVFENFERRAAGPARP